jgi:Uma2 family endonuclease
MTAVMPQRPALEFPEPVVLTAQEYDALSGDSRIELVDGVLHVMTAPTRRHQQMVETAKAALEAVCADDLVIVREQEVRLADLWRRNPDLMAVHATADDLDNYSYNPKDVVLTVEVVSPGTQTTDRLHKPAEYAAVGVERYWRVEIAPKLEVHTYRLGETGRYLESGLFTVGDTVAAPGLPWAKIEVAELEPKARKPRPAPER